MLDVIAWIVLGMASMIALLLGLALAVKIWSDKELREELLFAVMGAALIFAALGAFVWALQQLGFVEG